MKEIKTFRNVAVIGIGFVNNVVFAGGSINLSDAEALKPFCDGIYISNNHCHGEFIFPKGLNVFSQNDVLVTASERIVLKGENIFGDESNTISLRADGNLFGPSIEIWNSNVYGDVISNYGIGVRNSNINGNITSSSGTVDIEDSIIIGGTESNGQVKAKSTNFCGDIISLGSSIELFQEKHNVVVGNVESLFNTSILGGSVLGSVFSSGSNITTSANVYSYDNAINAFTSVQFKNNPIICGDIIANVSVTGSYQYKCGLNDKECSDQNVCDVNLEAFNQCSINDPIPPYEGELAIVASPSSSISLICESDKTKFSVNTFNNGQPTSLMFNATMSMKDVFRPITYDKEDGSYVRKIGDSFLMQTNQHGELTFNLDVNSSVVEYDKEYSILLSLVEDPSKKQELKLKFVPQIFRVNDGLPLNLIAGKSEQSSIVLMACSNDNENVIVPSYSGVPTIDISLIHPKQGLKDIQVEIGKFEKGRASLNVLSNEAGKFEVVIKDSFKCGGFLSCPATGEVVINGQAEIYSRPWTFAVCQSDLTPLPSGNIFDVSSTGFIAAGEKFDIAVLPIRWQVGGATAGPIVTQNNYCNTSQLTINFAKGEAGILQISLNHNLTLPASGGEAGNLSGTTSKNYLDDDNLKGYYLFNDLSWNEVGQLQLQASSGNYLGLAIQAGYKAVGRFYPKYFKIVSDSTNWDYASTQSFNYMNQPFDGVKFDVEAFDAEGNDILNYRYFNSNLQAKFQLQELNYLLEDSRPRLISPAIIATSWDSRLTSTLGVFSLRADDNCLSINSLCWLKASPKEGYEDGPFNLFESTNEDFTSVTNIVINDGGSVDPIAFRTGENRLTVQPDLRFGRANLNSVGGVVSDSGIKVPLRLEYWNGSRFIINGDDSSTEIKGSNVVTNNNVIWTDAEMPELAAEVNLSEGGIVSGGTSNLIVAKQDKLKRQQTQVWLELVDDHNDLPWLQYFWDTDSDTEGNASAVVTFGIYRGNDKVIFRAESNMYGGID
ncbi:DUF6701 domain-containing protein [Vibrio sp. zbq_2]|uniref:DUF6701 domain-containing protein n=1 Tax=Vibrio sp. zbq_2 TaxID=3367238 RepID=UPI00370C78E2